MHESKNQKHIYGLESNNWTGNSQIIFNTTLGIRDTNSHNEEYVVERNIQLNNFINNNTTVLDLFEKLLLAVIDLDQGFRMAKADSRIRNMNTTTEMKDATTAPLTAWQKSPNCWQMASQFVLELPL